MGAAIGILVVILIIFFAIAILLVASNWKIFKKSGEEGWKALIPYYNTWTLCNIVGINPNWVFIIIGCSVLSMVPMLNIVGGLAAIYFQVLINVSLAKSFGKDTGFGIGLLLLPVIFYPILGFGKDQYVGKNPMQDMIFKNNNVSNNNPTTTQQNVPNNMATQTPQNQATKFCTNCGAQIPSDSQFCTNCGSQTN